MKNTMGVRSFPLHRALAGTVGAILLTLASCANPFSAELETVDTGTSTVAIYIDALQAQSIIPEIASSVDSYAVTLSRDGHTDLSASGSDTGFTFEDVAVGGWTVDVQALGATGHVLGVGQTEITVSAAGSNSFSVEVHPTQGGTGELSVSIRWTPTNLVDGVESATLTPDGGNAQDITSGFSLSGDTAAYTASLASGLYQLVIRLSREGRFVGVVMEAVHIYDNATTTGTIELDESDLGQAPQQPTGLSIETTGGVITLEWIDVSPVNDTYEIQWRDASEPDFTNLVSTDGTATSHEHTGVPVGDYEYRIRATNAFGPTGPEEGWQSFPAVSEGSFPAAPAPSISEPSTLPVEDARWIITSSVAGGTVYYTTNGTDPVPGQAGTMEYDAATDVVLNAVGGEQTTYTIKAVVTATGLNPSTVTSLEATVIPGSLVTNGNDSGPGSLRGAVQNAQAGDTIAFAEDLTIQLDNSSFLGININKEVTIDGTGKEIVIDADDKHRHFFIDSGGDATIRNLRLRRGKATTIGGSTRVSSGTTLVLEGVEFYDDNRPNALANDGGTVTIRNSLFRDNFSGSGNEGGAIVNRNNGTLKVYDSSFVRNVLNDSALQSDLEQGGAIFADSGTTTHIVRSLFAENEADRGSAIHSDGALTIQGSLFSSNISRFDFVNGGAVSTSASDVVISNSVFHANLPNSDNSTNIGAMIHVDGGSGSRVRVVNSSFIDNYALHVDGTNLAFDSESKANSSTLNYSLGGVGMGTSGSNNISSDAEFVRAPGPGLDGAWGTDDDDWGDLRLTSGSAGIDAGDDSGLAADDDDLDNDGFTNETLAAYGGGPRVRGMAVDMGAAESEETGVARPIINPEPGIYTDDFDVVLSAPGAESIYYTTDGSDPDPQNLSGPTELYTGPISVDPPRSLTVKAVAEEAGGNVSGIAIAEYESPGTIIVTTATWDGSGSLDEALTNVADGGIIAFDGDYTITAPATLSSPPSWFSLSKSVTIDAGTNSIVLDANSAGQHFDVSSGTTLTLRADTAGGGSLTLRNGVGKNVNGGSVFLGSGSALVTEGVTFSNNETDKNSGGAIFMTGASAVVRNSVFDGNESDRWGGAIVVNNSSTLIVENSEFRNNATAGDLSGNRDSFGGAAITIQAGSEAEVSDSLFEDNSLNGPDSDGGALRSAGSLTVKNSRFYRNQALDLGGAIHSVDPGSPELTIIGSEFAGNSAIAGGGAVHVDGGTSSTVSSIFYGNTVSNGPGGAVYAVAGTHEIINSSFAGNGQSSSSEVVMETGTGTITNSLFADDDLPGGSGLTLTYSFVEAASFPGTGNIGTQSPLIAVDQPSAGADGTWGTSDDNVDFSVLENSPVIDSGLNTALPTDEFDLDGDGNETELLPTDFAGNTRTVDGTVDMGAYERQ